MTTRCKSGDLAVILYDVPSCEANIGRVVEVRGPAMTDRNGRMTWLIWPVTSRPYLINDWDGRLIGIMNSGDSNIEHPDAWMMPLRPKSEPANTENQLELVEH